MIDASKNCKTTPVPGNVKEFFRSWFFWKPLIAVVTGGIAGYLFYYFIGCTSGSCLITSNPYGSVITGSLLGFFITSGPCARC